MSGMNGVGSGNGWQALQAPRFAGPANVGAPPAVDTSRGYPVGDGSFAASVRGTAPQRERDLHFAMMANDAYQLNPGGATGSQSERELAAAGWQRLTPVGERLVDAQGRAIPISPGLLHDQDSGFDAAIYQNPQGQYVVAFRGTDSWRLGPGGDATTNGGQGIGLPTDQYEQALRLARTAEDAFGKGNVAFAGHSLGGGLATAAMLAVDAPGVTFNAAGLSDNTLRALHLGQSANTARADAADSGQIRRYNIEGELLTGLQQVLPLPDAVGHELRVAAPRGSNPWNPLQLHGGGGDGAPYVEALRDQAAYRPATLPPLLRMAGQTTESGGKVLTSLVVNTHDAGAHVGAMLRDKADAVAGVARTDFAQGQLAAGGLRVAGEAVDGVLEVGAGLAENAIDFAGDVTMEATTLGGNWLRNVGAQSGLEAPARAMASRLENAGQQANGAIDRAGAAVGWGLGQAGDGARWAANQAADGARWATSQAVEGARWTAGKAIEGAQWTADKVVEGAQWAADKVVGGARWSAGKALEGAQWTADKVTDGVQWLGDRASDAGRWMNRLNPFGGH